ncbi:hypothetical protein BGZ67_008654 [Mortierella alpina]|nr:hypothetical protein BGZ67_008654 [Mortierella alpina]
MFQQLPYNPQGLAATPSSLALPSTFAQPSAPLPPEAQLQLQFSSHPRPNVVTTIGDEVKEGVIEEAKGDPEGDAWDDTTRPNASSFKTSPDARNPHEVQADVVITVPSLDIGHMYPMDQDLLPPRPAHNPHTISVTFNDQPEESTNF